MNDVQQAPCSNPSCKSYGKVHPNCQCGQGLAEGGEVSHFCSRNNPHGHECEYINTNSNLALKSEDSFHDHNHSVPSYLAEGGLIGLIKMHENKYIDKYHHAIKKGEKSIHTHVDHIFGGDKLPIEKNIDSRKDIEDWIAKGGIDDDIQQQIYKSHNAPKSFADGGEVDGNDDNNLHNDAISSKYPDHNMTYQMAKGRVSQYLNALRPQDNTPKLAFDPEPDQRQQKKAYDKAVKIAHDPLSVLREIKKGTIEPDDVRHLNEMYPELNEAIQKKVTKKIVEAQLSGKKPSYTMRQGLSLFMGTPLSGEMTPQNIRAAQAVFQSQGSPQQGAPQQGQKPPKKTSALSKSSQAFLTGGQSVARRQQRQS